MLSKNKIKYIQSLRLKKNRLKNRTFLVEGEKIVEELLQDGQIKVQMVCATDTWIETHQHHHTLLNDMLISVDERQLKQISNLRTPNQVLAVAEFADDAIDWSLAQKSLSLYLDDIQDPGNMGTILRIADWFGIKHVFCSPHSADIHNPKVVQASMGAFLRVQYHKCPFETWKTNCPHTPVFVSSLDGENIFEKKLPHTALIVIGNESKGVSTSILEQADQLIRIPSAAQSGAESLNAGVATGIICALFAVRRL